MNKNRIFYGWYVAIACFIFELTILGLANGTSSLYVKPICDDMGFSRGVFSLTYSIASILSTISALTFGLVLKRLGSVRRTFIIGMSSIITAFVLYHKADNIVLFYLGGAFMGIGTVYAATVPLSIVISNWFVDKRGTVLGAVFAGSGIGGAVMNPVVGSWIKNHGWRNSYLYSIMIITAICIPALFVMKSKPSELGLEPYGQEKLQKGVAAKSDGSGPTLKQALRTKTFWITMLAVLFIGMSVQPLYINSSAHMGSIGIDPGLIAGIMSITFISNTIAKLTLGNINDRYGLGVVVLINNSAFAAAVLVLIATRSSSMGFLFAALFGVAYTLVSITVPLLISKLFGGKDYGAIMGVIQAAQVAGYAIGTPLGGFSYDLFGSYSYAFGLQILLDIGAAVLMLYALRAFKGSPKAA